MNADEKTRTEEHPAPESAGETSRLIETRRAKAAELRKCGINPYPYRFERTHTAAEALADFEKLSENKTEIRIAGRIMLKRDMGKSIFADLHDQSGKLQLYVKIDNVGEGPFGIFGKLDVGDIIGATGTVFVTRKGEKSLRVTGFEVLCKALHPLPDKHAGLTNVETRYRQRYVDLIMSPDVRDVFTMRSKIVQAARDFLNGKGFLEVETPILQPIYGGASARPFKTHHNTLDADLYLRVADELYLKRLIVGGFEKVWEYCKDFRNEGMSRFHNPEFSMIELYWAYADYFDMMNLAEEMYRAIAHAALGAYTCTFGGIDIDFEPAFERVTMIGGIKEHGSVDLSGMSYEEALAEAKKREFNTGDLYNWGKVVESFFERYVEPTLKRPTFVMDFPRDISPLAKVHRDNERLSERFEIFLAGLECGNAFSELNDPDDQRDRFLAQVAAAKAGDPEAPNTYDADYVTALQYGMPPTAGFGFGIDRLVMILTNQPSIRDVLLFPQLRPE